MALREGSQKLRPILPSPATNGDGTSLGRFNNGQDFGQCMLAQMKCKESDVVRQELLKTRGDVSKIMVTLGHQLALAQNEIGTTKSNIDYKLTPIINDVTQLKADQEKLYRLVNELESRDQQQSVTKWVINGHDKPQRQKDLVRQLEKVNNMLKESEMALRNLLNEKEAFIHNEIGNLQTNERKLIGGKNKLISERVLLQTQIAKYQRDLLESNGPIGDMILDSEELKAKHRQEIQRLTDLNKKQMEMINSLKADKEEQNDLLLTVINETSELRAKVMAFEAETKKSEREASKTDRSTQVLQQESISATNTLELENTMLKTKQTQEIQRLKNVIKKREEENAVLKDAEKALQDELSEKQKQIRLLLTNEKRLKNDKNNSQINLNLETCTIDNLQVQLLESTAAVAELSKENDQLRKDLEESNASTVGRSLDMERDIEHQKLKAKISKLKAELDTMANLKNDLQASKASIKELKLKNKKLNTQLKMNHLMQSEEIENIYTIYNIDGIEIQEKSMPFPENHEQSNSTGPSPMKRFRSHEPKAFSYFTTAKRLACNLPSKVMKIF